MNQKHDRFSVKFTVNSDQADFLTSIAFLQGCLGTQEEEIPGGIIRFQAFFPSKSNQEEILQALKEAGAQVTETNQVQHKDWEAEYRKNLLPIRLTGKYYVKPEWSDFAPEGGEVLVLEPKMTFGTGHHSTTRLCAGFLETISVAGKKILDAGTGTGILAFLSERMGAASVIAFDNDSMVVENVVENAQRNSSANVRFFIGEPCAISKEALFDVIAANLIRDVILEVLPVLSGHLSRNGALILSGLLHADRECIIKSLPASGLAVHEERSEGEWIALLCRKIT